MINKMIKLDRYFFSTAHYKNTSGIGPHNVRQSQRLWHIPGTSKRTGLAYSRLAKPVRSNGVFEDG